MIAKKKISGLQQIFDHVARHLLTQRKKAEVKKFGGYSCAYRTKSGLACAAGCLIPDKELNTNDLTIPWLATSYCKKYSDLENLLIRKLQLIHDGAEVKNWKESLEFLAANFWLKNNVLKEFKK